jgi:hypothetical protein
MAAPAHHAKRKSVLSGALQLQPLDPASLFDILAKVPAGPHAAACVRGGCM